MILDATLQEYALWGLRQYTSHILFSLTGKYDPNLAQRIAEEALEHAIERIALEPEEKISHR